jgi:hypothetical protein
MTLAALATMSTVAIAQERAAPSACQPLPEVSWWNSNQRDIVALVDQRYGGNWDAYIEKWDDYRRRMQAIYDKGSVAVVKSQDLRLEGAELAEHIEQVRARISTTKCLALENGAKSLENFETAAGGDPSQRIQPREPIVSTLELAAVDGKVYETKISASCDDRSAVFQVANLGDKWPKTAMVTLFAEDGKTMISEREIRLSDKQNVMFQAKYDTGRRNGNVRLRIDPSWTGQQASYEAHIICD